MQRQAAYVFMGISLTDAHKAASHVAFMAHACRAGVRFRIASTENVATQHGAAILKHSAEKSPRRAEQELQGLIDPRAP